MKKTRGLPALPSPFLPVPSGSHEPLPTPYTHSPLHCDRQQQTGSQLSTSPRIKRVGEVAGRAALGGRGLRVGWRRFNTKAVSKILPINFKVLGADKVCGAHDLECGVLIVSGGKVPLQPDTTVTREHAALTMSCLTHPLQNVAAAALGTDRAHDQAQPASAREAVHADVTHERVPQTAEEALARAQVLERWRRAPFELGHNADSVVHRHMLSILQVECAAQRLELRDFSQVADGHPLRTACKR